jgi:hypothetical protein
MSFDQVVRHAGVAVEGTVIDLKVSSTGADIRSNRVNQHTSPAVSGEQPVDAKAAGQIDPSTRPLSVGVEGGRMLFTEVTMAVDSDLLGSAGSSVLRFRIAGGTDGRGTMIVFGMPSFEIGKRYVVFLEPSFETTNVPIVGVNQGYFEIVRSEQTGEEIVLNADGDIVTGIDRGQVVLKHNPDRADGRVRLLADAPVPAAGSEVQASLSPEAMRYWSSDEPPLSREAFVSAVRTAVGGVQ